MLHRDPKHLVRALVAAALLTGATVYANQIVNGDFETGDFSGWTTSIDPTWDGVDNQNPQSGSFAAYFGNPSGTSSIAQTLATVGGQTYHVEFWLANEADPNGVSTPNSFEFDWGGTPQLILVDAGAFGYKNYAFNLLAPGAATTLSFSFSHTPAFWDLDTVSAAAVPEPATSALALAGLLVVAAGVGRARRRVA
jgi:hypothetical protein